eukprot:gb/GECH01004019.1/.p1 GENE.gb/GECH01004019.1/~~gb/GECH01004019.1/.p1  ORF type:complete len:189 (+),score=24.49 gb/GECH01004019.1/:1-567(+)
MNRKWSKQYNKMKKMKVIYLQCANISLFMENTLLTQFSFYSRGYVRLRSCDPFDKPLVNHKIWSHPSDVTILRKGVEHVLKLSRSQPLADEYQPFLPDPFLERDIEDSIRRTSITLCHPCGTCRLGNQGDEKAVVDERLRVQGVSGLRVADGSVIPFITSGNTNGTCLMIGDKAAAIIMKDHYELNRK